MRHIDTKLPARGVGGDVPPCAEAKQNLKGGVEVLLNVASSFFKTITTCQCCGYRDVSTG